MAHTHFAFRQEEPPPAEPAPAAVPARKTAVRKPAKGKPAPAKKRAAKPAAPVVSMTVDAQPGESPVSETVNLSGTA